MSNTVKTYIRIRANGLRKANGIDLIIDDLTTIEVITEESTEEVEALKALTTLGEVVCLVPTAQRTQPENYVVCRFARCFEGEWSWLGEGEVAVPARELKRRLNKARKAA